MQLQEAILAVERKEIPHNLEAAKVVLEKQLKKLAEEEYETRGTYYYYLLRISLETHLLFENEIEHHLYEKLCACFAAQEEKYFAQYEQDPQNALLKAQISAFYRLIERYYTTLEVSYHRKNFEQAQKRVYLQKMRYRKKAAQFEGNIAKALLYNFWEVSSLYGTSFFRWGITCLVTILIFSGIYFVFDGLQHAKFAGEAHWYDTIHFSIATFTTLGFGDVIPVTLFSKIMSDIEVFSGYLMLGAFMGLVQKRSL